MKSFSAKIIILLIMCIMCSAFGAYADTGDTDGDYVYVLAGKNAVITAYKGSGEGELTIPSTLDGYTVTGIYVKAFANCNKLTSVTVPDTVTSIEVGAFSGCTSLEEMTLPFVGSYKGADNSESGLFGYIFGSEGENLTRQYYKNQNYKDWAIPKSLKKVTITKDTSVAYGSFYNCNMLESVTLPATTGIIGKYAFYNCTGLKEVTIPDNYQSIYESAFENCTSLERISLPDKISNIGKNAFCGCTALKSIVLPQNLKTIGAGVFKGCTSLKCIDLPDGVTTMGNEVFMGCSLLKSVTLSSTLKSIGASAFENCVALEGISIPQTVNAIYRDAFKNTHLANTPSNYVQGVLYIDGWAIAALSEVQSISVPDGTKYIAQEAFKDRTNLKEATLPQTLEKLGSSAFAGCTSLEKLTIPFVGLTPGESGGYENVFGSLFEMTTSSSGATYQQYGNNGNYAKYYKIPQTIKEITVTGSYLVPTGAFYNCSTIEKINLSDDISSVNANAFYGCTSLTDVNIPRAVTEIKASTFHDCSSLKDVAIPAGVTKISDSAFRNCTLLKNPAFPETLEVIDASAYDGCSSIDTINVPNSVLEIKKGAFRNCTSLKEITLPFIGVQRGGTDGTNQVFGHIFGFDSYSGQASVPVRYREGGVYYYYIPQSLKKVTVTDESVIPYGAFDGCSFIDEIIIEGAPETVGVCAFGNFSGEAVDVTIKDKQVKYSEGEAFNGSPMATLYGYGNSTSEAYADAYKVDFVPIDGKENAYTWQKYRIDSLYIKEGDSIVSGVPSSEFKAMFTITNQGGYANDMIAVVFFTEDGAMSHLALAPINVPFGKTGLVECRVDNRQGYADNFKIFMINGVNIAPLSKTKTYK